jgi:hypothetical protein
MCDCYVVSIPYAVSAPRSRVTLPVLIDDASGVTAGGISLRCDVQSLKAIKVTSTDLLANCYQVERIDEGEIHIAFVSAAPLNGSGELLYIEFEVVYSIPDFTDIALEEVSLSENIHVAKIDGSIEVLPTNTVLLNPFNPETWIPYRLAEDANVKVSIYDSKGRTVRVIDLGHQPAGSYLHKDRAVSWDGRNNSGEKIANGIYYYQTSSRPFFCHQEISSSEIVSIPLDPLSEVTTNLERNLFSSKIFKSKPKREVNNEFSRKKPKFC